MKGIHSSILISVAVLCILMLSCRQAPPQTDDVPVYTFPPQGDQPETDITPEPETPAATETPDNNDGYTVRNIVVDRNNSIFSIGIPAGQSEETEVTAEKPIDFWFEYLPAEASLEVNGEKIQRDPFHWETKVSYTTAVTDFEYRIDNTTGNYISYNLHLVPSASGETVPVVIRQRWIP
jgi:hypothetical protein